VSAGKAAPEGAATPRPEVCDQCGLPIVKATTHGRWFHVQRGQDHPAVDPTHVFWTSHCVVAGCTGEPHPRQCPGDGRYHHHGGIHLAPGTSLREIGWGWLCDAHYAQAKGEWAALRVLRAAERARQQ
jgi:hypothetical protein